MKTFNLNRLFATYGVAFFLLLANACGGEAKKDSTETATPKATQTEKAATDAHKGHNHSHEGHNHGHSHEGHNHSHGHSHEGHNHSHEGHNHGKAAETKKAGE